MSQFNNQIIAHYMDDILRNIKRFIERILNVLINIYPSLIFTIECKQNGRLPFLDMFIIQIAFRLYSTWYCKLTNTGLNMNDHALEPGINDL